MKYEFIGCICELLFINVIGWFELKELSWIMMYMCGN